jgi:hypothetical protein
LLSPFPLCFFPLAKQADVLAKMELRIEALSKQVERLQNDGLGGIEATPDDVECLSEDPDAEESPAQMEARENFLQRMQDQSDYINRGSKRKAKEGDEGKRIGSPPKKRRVLQPRDPPLTENLKQEIVGLMEKFNSPGVIYNHVRSAHDSQFKVPVGSQLKKLFSKDKKKKSFFLGHVKELNSDCTYKILYEDGDGEDLYFHELEPLLADPTVVVRPVIHPPPFPTKKRIKYFIQNFKQGKQGKRKFKAPRAASAK